MSDAHIPQTNHPSSAGCERSEPHALSNAQIPTTFRAQVASDSSPTCSLTHTYQHATTHHQTPTAQHTHSADSERQAERATAVFERSHTTTKAQCAWVRWFMAFVCLLLQQCSPCIILENPLACTYNINLCFEILSSKKCETMVVENV